MKIYFVTGNANKFSEVKAILSGYDVEQLDIDLPELQGEPEEIASQKAIIACEKTGKSIVVEDTSLCLNELNGLPGPYIKHFLEKLGAEGFYDLVAHCKDKSAYAQTIVAYCRPEKQSLTFKGKIDGTIVPPAGNSGFKFDKIFMPTGYELRFSEMPIQLKNSISHRKRAFENFRNYLEQHKP